MDFITRPRNGCALRSAIGSLPPDESSNFTILLGEKLPLQIAKEIDK